MKQYILLYCIYNPDAYVGHRVHRIDAKDLKDAKKQAKTFLDRLYHKDLFEFGLIEIAADYGFRVWDTKSEPNLAENAYTTETFWDS